MSEMVERVARRICRAAIMGVRTIEGEPNLAESGMLDRLVEDKWEAYAPIARAAIEAMREPTNEMIAAGYDEEKVGYGPDGVPAELVWEAMIDAALGEE